MKIKIVYVNIESNETVLTLDENVPYFPLIPIGASITIDDKEYSIGDASQVTRTDISETIITIDLKPEFVHQEFTAKDFPWIDAGFITKSLYGFEQMADTYFNAVSKLYRFKQQSGDPTVTEEQYQQGVKDFICGIPYRFRMERHMVASQVMEFFEPYAEEQMVGFFNEQLRLGNIIKIKLK